MSHNVNMCFLVVSGDPCEKIVQDPQVENLCPRSSFRSRQFWCSESSPSTTTQFGGTGRREKMLLREQKRPFFSNKSWKAINLKINSQVNIFVEIESHWKAEALPRPKVASLIVLPTLEPSLPSRELTDGLLWCVKGENKLSQKGSFLYLLLQTLVRMWGLPCYHGTQRQQSNQTRQ